ncbi:PepSY domain-containing protein [Sphingobacterium corticis]|uniref:NADPH--hemoprotein reductase n=1 Tax=Sphingobacterium corticis TaxID=1812823 RepID=A0ABW5NJN9_9SPHI
MTLSIWRYAHLVLAWASSLFLLLLSVTGIILAYDAVDSNSSNFAIADLDTISLANTVSQLKQQYPEILELVVDRQSRVYLDALNEDSEAVQGYIDPISGKLLGAKEEKSDFIQWTTTLHRSLFLHETGRIVVGVISFLLLLITISGILLIVKRQQNWKRFFSKVRKDFFAQYFHVVSGRLMLIPILLIALTGTYLFLVRTNIIAKPESVQEYVVNQSEEVSTSVLDFRLFQQTKLSDVERIEFPFIEDDPEEFYIITLKDRQLTVSQMDGAILKETKYAYTAVWEKISLDLHTGQTNRGLAIVLGLAALNILFFIYTGFVITFRRTRSRIKNKFSAKTAEVILLVGSENGTTLAMANRVHKQLLDQGVKSFVDSLNGYDKYPNAKHLLVFTCTYGLGEAPQGAKQFQSRLAQFPQVQDVQFSVLGFGSKSYPDFCAYAMKVDALLQEQTWAKQILPLYTVNDRSADDVVNWVHAWTKESGITLATAKSVYEEKMPSLQQFKVVSKTKVIEGDPIFKVVLKPIKRLRIKSGDLLAIYPKNDATERFYSIARVNGCVQLLVKLHPHGLGSGYLNELKDNKLLSARWLPNTHFHFPKKAKQVVMIANGTGIAPFLGMLDNNKSKIPTRLYVGFRNKQPSNESYAEFADKQINSGKLSSYHVAYSREVTSQYVLDLIKEDAEYFANLLADRGVILICGALQMQRDVESILDELLAKRNLKDLAFYRDRGQLLTDCY